MSAIGRQLASRGLVACPLLSHLRHWRLTRNRAPSADGQAESIDRELPLSGDVPMSPPTSNGIYSAVGG
jgi:hypothetical protein